VARISNIHEARALFYEITNERAESQELWRAAGVDAAGRRRAMTGGPIRVHGQGQMTAQPQRPAHAAILGVNWVNRDNMARFAAFGTRRRHAAAHMASAPLDDEARRIRAALERIDEWGELRDFAGRPQEKLALVTFARSRGLIAWQKARGRHELTSAGRKWLIAHGGIARVRRSKFPSRMVAATLGVTVLAGAWFSANASYQMFSPPSPAVTGYLALHHLSVKLDPMAARLAHSPADQHPLAMIQSDAPIFAATRRDAGGGTAKLAAAEPSKPLNHATKSTAKPSRKVARVSPRVYPLPQWGNPQWGNDRGSAMAFSDTGRPPRW
jgi:hypothetical protein